MKGLGSSFDGGKRKGNRVIDDDDDFTLSFQCRQTDRPFFALLFPPSFTS